MFAIGLPSSGYFAVGLPDNDLTAPTLQAARINGTSLRLTFSEPVTVNVSSGWSLTLSGGAANVTYSSGSGTRYLYYTVSRSVDPAETGTIDYTQPGDGIEDLAGNDLDSIASAAISVAGGRGLVRSIVSSLSSDNEMVRELTG